MISKACGDFSIVIAQAVGGQCGGINSYILCLPLSVGALVPQALAAAPKGGRVVCGGIHMSDIPSFPYRLLWEEPSVALVAPI